MYFEGSLLHFKLINWLVFLDKSYCVTFLQIDSTLRNLKPRLYGWQGWVWKLKVKNFLSLRYFRRTTQHRLSRTHSSLKLKINIDDGFLLRVCLIPVTRNHSRWWILGRLPPYPCCPAFTYITWQSLISLVSTGKHFPTGNKNDWLT